MRTALSIVVALLVAAAPPASAGLVNQWSFEEGSGTNTADTVGGQNGELQPTGNPPAWSADAAPVPSGSTWSLQFDGSNDLVDALGYKGITGTDPRSVSAWMKTTGVDNEPIISWGQNSAGQKWTFRVQDDNGPVGAMRIEVNGGYHVGTTNVADGQWHHVATTWADDGSPNVNDSRLWVDGQLEGRGAVQGQSMNTASNTDVRIGRAVINGRFFTGNIDEVQVYDEAVDRSTVRALAGLAPDAYFEAVKAAAPVGYWRLGEPSGNRAFNEGSLGSAADGAYNNSPILGQPGGAPGTDNTSAAFDGTNQYVQATDYKGITGTDPRTVSAWIKTDDDGNHSIVSWGANNAGEKWNLRVQDSNGPAGTIRVEVNGGYQVGTTFVADGEWHHVAATWEDDGVNTNVNDARLWVDGVLQGVGASQGQAMNTASGTDVRIGRDHENRYANGGIDEVAIFERAMSRSEIRALAGLAPDPYYDAVQANKPIGYWRLGEPSGGKAFNEGSLGAAVDGSYQNSPTQGQPSLAPTVSDTSVYFDGSNQQVNIPDHDAINTGGPYEKHSIEAWLNTDRHDTTTNRRVVYEQGGTNNGFNMYVQREASDDSYYLRYGAWTNLTGSQVNHFPDRVPIEPGLAYHAVSVYDATTDDFFVYINGAPAGGKINANIEPIAAHTADNAIGAKRDDTRFDNGGTGGGGNRWIGTLDEVAIYDAAVDLRSIQTHYVAGMGTPMALGLRKGTTLGVVLNYDASFDSDGNAAWEDTIGSRPFKDGQEGQLNQFDFALSGAPRVAVSSSLLPYITHAYEFDGNASATAREVDDVASEPTRFSASFEIVFKPSDFVGTEVVFDIGGETDGSAFWLEDSVLHFDVKDGGVNARPEFDLSLLPASQRADFLHVIGVADLDNDQALLYVNGILRAAAGANGDLADWAGGNDLGLGSIGGNMAFAEQDPFIGQIALARIYGGQGAGLLSAADVAANLEALQPEPTTMALLGLGALALVRRRRRR